MHSKEKEFFEDKIKEVKEREQSLLEKLEAKVGIENKLSKKEREVKSLNKELSGVKEALAKSENMATAALASSAELQKIRDELESESEKRQEQSNKNASLEAKVESLREGRDEKNQRISKFESKVEKLKNQLRNMEVEVKTSKRYVKEKDAELKKKSSMALKCEKSLAEIKDSAIKLEVERNDLSKKVEKYEKLL